MSISKIDPAGLDIGQIGGRRNLIINGAMQVAQRGTSFTSISSSQYTLDRFMAEDATDGTFTVSQDSSAPSGFKNSLKVEVTTADSSLSSSQYAIVRQRVEGNNCYFLNWGASEAKTVTISFYARSSVTGTHGGVICANTLNPAYPFTYTINSADTWEYKTITVEGPTTGTWATDNTTSVQVIFCLGTGATYAGTAGAWESSARLGASGQVNLMATNGATWYITGVQLEVGTVATPFEHRSFGEELALCQRYYYDPNAGSSGSLDGNFILVEAFSSGCVAAFQFPVTMRADPTVSIFGSKNSNAGEIRTTRTGAYVGSSAVATNVGNNGFGFVAGLTGLTTGERYDCTYKADAEL